MGSWRAGFEVEVILGDLGEPAFWDMIEPMDTASARYCQAVARELGYLTGEKWSAPRTPVKSPGFYVISEYDLDPLDWPRSRVAGVELLTPPLPIEEAERVRVKMVEAIAEMDGKFNFIRSEHTARCAWHINVDPAGDGGRIEPENFILGVEELRYLALSDRLGSEYAAPQHHSYGIALLRHLAIEPDLHLMGWTGLSNFLRQHKGMGKRYAANFAKLDVGYVELRHFSAEQFFIAAPLAELLRPMISGFEMRGKVQSAASDMLIARYRELSVWVASIFDRLSWDAPRPWQIVWSGKCYFDGEPLGTMIWNGSLDISIGSTKEYVNSGTIYDVQWPDIGFAIALLALDAAEHKNAKRRVPVTANRAFRKAVSDLAARLKALPSSSGIIDGS